MTKTRQELRQEQEEAYTHLLVDIFGWNDQSAGFQALKAAGYNSITDIVTLDKEEIDDMEYEADDGSGTTVIRKVPTKQKKLLKHALLYYDYQVKLRASKMFDAADWKALTKDMFEDFRETQVPLMIRSQSTSSTSVLMPLHLA